MERVAGGMMAAGEMGGSMSTATLDALLAHLKEQNALLARHPNAHVYHCLGATLELDGHFPGDMPGSYGWDSLTGELFQGDGYPKPFGAPTWGEGTDCVVGCGLLPLCKPSTVMEVSVDDEVTMT